MSSFERTRIETFPKLTEAVNGQYHIKDEPPLIYHYDPLDTSKNNLDTEQWRAMVVEYLASWPEERRVIIMQAASDIFLGWTTFNGMDYYARQLRDIKFSAQVEGMDPVLFTAYVELCATALARVHARTSDPAQISGYLGKGIRSTVPLPRSPRSMRTRPNATMQLSSPLSKRGACKPKLAYNRQVFCSWAL